MTAGIICSDLFYMGIAIVTVCLAGRAQNSRCKGCSFLVKTYLAAIFVILFTASALRFDVGNDYRQYTQTAHEAYVGGYVVTEAGFNMLVRIVYSLCGGECYELVFALFALVTLGLFLKALYEQSVDFSFSYFLFMTLGLYFQTYNTVRYYLALAVTLYAMRYVLQRDWIKFIFWIVMASFFHKSVLLVIPVYWAASFVWKRWMLIASVIISAACFFCRKYVLKVALFLYPSYENTVYLKGGTSLITTIRCVVVLVLYLWYVHQYEKAGKQKEQSVYCDKELRFYAKLNFLATLCSVFFSFLPVVTRIVYYLSVCQLLMIPRIVRKIEDRTMQKRVKWLVIIACILYFCVFLMAAGQEGVGLVPYKSWLFEEQRFLYK